MSGRSPLPQLLDCKGLQRELGVTRAAAEAMMRLLPSIMVPGLRKVYCRRPDLERLLATYTSTKPKDGRIVLDASLFEREPPCHPPAAVT